MVSPKHFEIRVDLSFPPVLFLISSHLTFCFILLDKYIITIDVSMFLRGSILSPFMAESGLAVALVVCSMMLLGLAASCSGGPVSCRSPGPCYPHGGFLRDGVLSSGTWCGSLLPWPSLAGK